MALRPPLKTSAITGVSSVSTQQGCWGLVVVVITHTETEDEIHIISMREAENHETRQFFSYL